MTNKALVEEARKEAFKDVCYLAKRALEACPDCSTQSVADALGLPVWKVNLLSSGGRTGQRVTYYHKEEILKLLEI